MKRCLGLPSFTPNYSLYVECVLQYIYIFTLKLDMNYVTKVLFHFDDGRLPKILLKHIITMKLDWWSEWESFGFKYNICWMS